MGGLTAGQVLAARYRLIAPLGSGGFGEVWRATELSLDRQVALKLLKIDQRGSKLDLERFLREAHIVQHLTHPNTVRIYDAGQLPDSGVPFIAWELLQGRTAEEALLEDGPFSPARAAHVTSQVLKSLMEAHRQGIVHRDIKPANIMLCDVEGDPDFVRVLDFGIAKPLHGLGGRDLTALTAQGDIIGTPQYMAPELIRDEELGPAADLYAVGLVLAELLTGQTVFQAQQVIQICLEHLSERPAPIPEPVRRSPLGPVVARATEKSLSGRYAEAARMLADLQALSLEEATSPLVERPPPAQLVPVSASAPTAQALSSSSGGGPSLALAQTQSSGAFRASEGTPTPPSAPTSAAERPRRPIALAVGAAGAALLLSGALGLGAYLFAENQVEPPSSAAPGSRSPEIAPRAAPQPSTPLPGGLQVLRPSSPPAQPPRPLVVFDHQEGCYAKAGLAAVTNDAVRRGLSNMVLQALGDTVAYGPPATRMEVTQFRGLSRRGQVVLIRTSGAEFAESQCSTLARRTRGLESDAFWQGLVVLGVKMVPFDERLIFALVDTIIVEAHANGAQPSSSP